MKKESEKKDGWGIYIRPIKIKQKSLRSMRSLNIIPRSPTVPDILTSTKISKTCKRNAYVNNSDWELTPVPATKAYSPIEQRIRTKACCKMFLTEGGLNYCLNTSRTRYPRFLEMKN